LRNDVRFTQDHETFILLPKLVLAGSLVLVCSQRQFEKLVAKTAVTSLWRW